MKCSLLRPISHKLFITFRAFWYIVSAFCMAVLRLSDLRSGLVQINSVQRFLMASKHRVKLPRTLPKPSITYEKITTCNPGENPLFLTYTHYRCVYNSSQAPTHIELYSWCRNYHRNIPVLHMLARQAWVHYLGSQRETSSLLPVGLHWNDQFQNYILGIGTRFSDTLKVKVCVYLGTL